MRSSYRTILSLSLANSEIQKLLSPFSLISRDLLACGASTAAKSLSPDSEALAHVHMFERYVVYTFFSPCHFN
jgi:hypothetical protein